MFLCGIKNTEISLIRKFSGERTCPHKRGLTVYMRNTCTGTVVCPKVGVVEEKLYGDAVQLQPVHSGHQKSCDHVAGMVPFLQKLIADVSSSGRIWRTLY